MVTITHPAINLDIAPVVTNTIVDNMDGVAFYNNLTQCVPTTW